MYNLANRCCIEEAVTRGFCADTVWLAPCGVFGGHSFNARLVQAAWGRWLRARILGGDQQLGYIVRGVITGSIPGWLMDHSVQLRAARYSKRQRRMVMAPTRVSRNAALTHSESCRRRARTLLTVLNPSLLGAGRPGRHTHTSSGPHGAQQQTSYGFRGSS